MSCSRWPIFLSNRLTSLRVISLSFDVFFSSWLAVEMPFCNAVISLCNCCFVLPLVFCAKADVEANNRKISVEMKNTYLLLTRDAELWDMSVCPIVSRRALCGLLFLFFCVLLFISCYYSHPLHLVGDFQREGCFFINLDIVVSELCQKTAHHKGL